MKSSKSVVKEHEDSYGFFPPLSYNGRIRWVDHVRGFTLLNTTIFWLFPFPKEGIVAYFASHPRQGHSVEHINYHDVGVVVYITLMGLMMARSFMRRSLFVRNSGAFNHMFKRYGAIFALGAFLSHVDLLGIEGRNWIYRSDGDYLFIAGLPVIEWGVLLSLGTVGIIATMFHGLSWKHRLLLAITLILFYQYMLINGGWREHVIASRHSGYLASFFSLSGLMLISVVIGEFLFCRENISEKFKLKFMLSIALACAVMSIFLCQFPDMYPNKRQMTLTYIAISLSITMLGSLVFIFIDRFLRKPIFLLDGFGRNPIVIFAFLLIVDILERHGLFIQSYLNCAILLTGVFIVVAYFDKRNIIIKI